MASYMTGNWRRTADVDKVKILVVDDLPEKLLVYRIILEDLGEELVTALSGTEALRHILHNDFAVILLDVNMPDMDGFETAALIRNRKRSAHTPIIFVTAFTDEVRLAEGYAHGAVDYIQAPVVPEILRAKIKVFVDLFRMSEQVKQQAEERVILAEERTRRTAAEESNRRLRFLAKAGAVIGQSLDYRVTSQDTVHLCIPVLADQAVLAQLEPITGQWSIVEATPGQREGDEPIVRELSELTELPVHCADALERTLQTAAPEFLSADHPDGEPESVVLPLRARGHTFAALLLSREKSGRRFSSVEVTMAETVAARAAIALDNARLYKDIEHADKQKNEFLSMLAHELRNPLAPIRNAVSVLRLQQQDQPDALWAQDVIDRQVTNMVRLVDDLLDVSRITRGKIRLECKCLSVEQIIQSAVETSRPLIDANNHQLTVELPSEPLFVQADEARLAQVLSNLLNNAAKYTVAGGSIWISAKREGDQVVFRVRDTGTGIPPEMLPKIFDLFTQVDQSIDRSQGGLGIGLTLVQRLVEMHGGSVHAASDGPGRGSEFTVRLPAVTGDASANGNGQDLSEIPRGLRKILVVDDNVDSAETLAKLMRLQGHSVQVAFDGPSALQSVQADKPDVVILDLGLPGITGFDVARILRDRGEDLLLVAVSGYGRDEDRLRSREAGFDHHFTKPVDFTCLLKIVGAAPAEGRPALQVT
jgi:signal transduction histidine kinase/DNA-binding response OmpR family regulator